MKPEGLSFWVSRHKDKLGYQKEQAINQSHTTDKSIPRRFTVLYMATA